MASLISIPSTPSSIINENLDTKFANVLRLVNESAFLHLSEVINILMKASRMERQLVNISENNFPVLPPQELIANVSTSENPQTIDNEDGHKGS